MQTINYNDEVKPLTPDDIYAAVDAIEEQYHHIHPADWYEICEILHRRANIN